MAAFSGFYESSCHASLSNAACSASTPPHGHCNGLRQRCIRLSPLVLLLGIIVAKACYGLLKLMPSININLIGVISLFVSYWLLPATMNAVLATIGAGGQARI